MRTNTQEKSLITVNENSIFYKIKKFFINLFHKNREIESTTDIEDTTDISAQKQDDKDRFIEYIRNIENEETKLLRLQKQYRTGEIKEEELTQEQINSLCSLYDKQIANLRESNQVRKQRILEHRRKLQADN